MKRNNWVFVRWQVVVLALAVIVAALPGPAYCQIDGTALLLQQTPPQAGNITPPVGVHKFEPYTQVTLTAVPKPGYQFVYWLGDVDDPAANTTFAYLDAPKIIIAVFERVKYEFLPVKEKPQGGAPIGGLSLSPADYARQGGGGGAGGYSEPEEFRWPSLPEPEQEDFPVPQEEQDFPVPQEGQDFPVPQPIPEPATAVLLVLGCFFASTGKRNHRHNLQ